MFCLKQKLNRGNFNEWIDMNYTVKINEKIIESLQFKFYKTATTE